MTQTDIYAKLRPPGPTPADEICSCTHERAMKLMCALGYNPIHCMDCNLEISPETLELPESLIDAIAFWRNIYDSIDRLWLASGDYEAWAKDQLLLIESPVNTLGRKVQMDLNRLHRCYYWHFQDEDDEKFCPARKCPICDKELTIYPNGLFQQLLCESCSLVMVAES